MKRLFFFFFLLGIGCKEVPKSLLKAEKKEIKKEGEKSKSSTSKPLYKVIYPKFPGSFVNLIKQVQGGVVNIYTTKRVRGGPYEFYPRGRGDPFGLLERFFGLVPPEQLQRSLGSGFIIDKKGHILTNWHVIENADVIMIQLNTGQRLQAKIVGKDPKTDIALVKIRAKSLTPLPLGDSDSLEVGEWVLAIGNPFGLSNTVTAGIISAKGRTEDNITLRRGGYYNLIQTDASINPGNSGGPLLNIFGEVVGVNTAIKSGGQGIGFAIPINMVKQILPQLIKKGYVIRSWLGVFIRPITEEIAQSLKFKGQKGVLISEVVPEGPADQAGLKQGDIITKFNNIEIQSLSQLLWLVSTAGVNKVVNITIWRMGSEKTFKVRLERMPE
jgi:Do/DeqQ family serine protease